MITADFSRPTAGNSETSTKYSTSSAAAGPPPPHARHDLRHVHATMLLLAGVPVHVVADRLGHADRSTTLRRTPTSSVIRQHAAGIADRSRRPRHGRLGGRAATVSGGIFWFKPQGSICGRLGAWLGRVLSMSART
ncbi:tyrosine-type recombinase/integrase [Kribbella sp. NPDC026596]|uniref:tyrosine-type recombinase/integrase n=1 Tax=Kribbella sp. NPDC026596 TaxID=3155122 RepID=UPI0033E5CEB6